MLIENCSQNCYGNIRNSHTYVICLSGKRSLNSSSKTIENYYCVSRTHPRVPPLFNRTQKRAITFIDIYIYIFFIGKTVYFEHMNFISRTYFSYTKITIHRIYLLYKNTKERKLITEQLSLFVWRATNDWSRAIDRQSRKQKWTSRLTCRSFRRFSIVIGKYVAQRALLLGLDE